MDRDHYAVLGVTPGASPQELQRAFRRKALTAHPDRGGSNRQMAIVEEAWETLRDPQRRAAYDARNGHRAAAPAGSPPAGAAARGTGTAVKRGAGPSVPGRKKGPRPPSLAQVAGTMFGKAFRALTGWSPPKPKVKRKTGRPVMPIVRCVNCGQRLRVRKTVMTARIVCPRCKQVQPER